MKYWWVNQSKENINNYLWVPEKKSVIRYPFHWKTIQHVNENDIVFNYSKGHLIGYSLVIKKSYKFKRYFDHNKYDTDGLQVDLKYNEFNKPIPLESFSNELLEYLQEKYSPLNKKAKVNQGYLYPLNNDSGDFLLNFLKIDLKTKSENFVLNEVEIINSRYKSNKIKLINEKHKFKDNYYSLIIGNNGIGKSRVLTSICKYFIDDTFKYKDSDEQIFLDHTKNPTKIISISHGISDKFPLDKTNNDDNKDISDERYIYLGTRNRTHTHSTRVLINKAIDILVESYVDKSIAHNYREIFKYLGYLAKIKLKFSFVNPFGLKNKVSYKELEKYLLKKSEGSSFSSSYIEKCYNKDDEDYEENQKVISKIVDFYHNLTDKNSTEKDLTIDFSELNINSLLRDENIYTEKFELYKVLKSMNKFSLTNSFSVNLYNNENIEFNFNDASSGESNILSTLMALVPIIEDNCLVLIDEPEISLHPSWQNQYMGLLKKLFSHVKGCHIIIASHSPFLVSDLPIGNASVINLYKEKGIIKSSLIKESTFGWSSENILLNVFNLASTRNYYLSDLVGDALSLISKKDKDLNEINKIKEKLSKLDLSLKEYDPLKKIIKTILETDYE